MPKEVINGDILNTFWTVGLPSQMDALNTQSPGKHKIAKLIYVKLSILLTLL
jgi:hypothetical protein